MSDAELPHSKPGADPVVRLIVTHWVLGAALGIACAGIMLWLNVAGLGSALLGADHVVWEGVVLLFGGFASTFGGAVAAVAVMSVPCHDDGDDGRPGCVRDASAVDLKFLPRLRRARRRNFKSKTAPENIYLLVPLSI